MYGPDKAVLYAVKKESSGHYTLTASTDGIYTYCFNNKMSTVTPKTVLFSLEMGGTNLAKEEGASRKSKCLLMFSVS